MTLQKTKTRGNCIRSKVISCGIHALTAVLLITLIIPPTLFAQMLSRFDDHFGQFHVTPGSNSFNGMDPGRENFERIGGAIVTSPEAFEPDGPSYAACPRLREQFARNSEGARSQPDPRFNQFGQRELLVDETGGMGSRSSKEMLAETGLGLPGSLLPKAIAENEARTLDRMTDPGRSEARRDGGIVGGPSDKEFSIEENFARTHILQQVTKQLRQFGYRFFETPGPSRPPVRRGPVSPEYVLGPEDALSLHIWDVPYEGWNGNYIVPVHRDGTVFIPKLGSLSLAGTSFRQAERIIQSRLQQLLKRFEMHLSMVRLRTMTVYVVGEVNRPGAYELNAHATVSYGLYAACGPSKSGSLRRIEVIRDGKPIAELDFYKFLLRGDRTQDIRLQSGDTILVSPVGSVAAITGPVKRPAIYELKSRTTLANLIDLAGGLFPTADRRRVQVLRVEAGAQRVILNLEMQKPFNTQLTSGTNHTWQLDKAAHFVIQDGDVVRIASVPARIKNAVKLEGTVRNPGVYQFQSGMRISDVLTPDQMLPDSYWERAEIVRTDPVTYERTVIPFDPLKVLKREKEADRTLERLDTIIISTQARSVQEVMVEGEVKRPGVYPIENGERLSSVLKRAGGMTSYAFPQGLIFIRESIRKEQQSEMMKFVAQQQERMITEAANIAAGEISKEDATQEQASLNMQLQALKSMANRIRYGRVVVKMDSIEQLEGTSQDITLKDGDMISIPVQPNTVTVVGAVHNSISIAYEDNLQVEDYLSQAGGLSKYASRDEMYIVRANGSTETSYVEAQNIRAGDTIVVPAKMEAKTRMLPLWKAVAGVVGGAVLSVAGLAVIATR